MDYCDGRYERSVGENAEVLQPVQLTHREKNRMKICGIIVYKA